MFRAWPARRCALQRRVIAQQPGASGSHDPGDQQWDIALFKNFVLRGSHRIQFRAEVFNFINHPNLSGPNTDITNSNFGRIITKDGSRRDIQLALRYYF